jgi:hypothetical protein
MHRLLVWHVYGEHYLFAAGTEERLNKERRMGGNTMKDKTVSEKTLVIDIKLSKGLMMALCCVLMVVASLTYLTLTGERAVASEAETVQAASTGMRQFYLTTNTHFPPQAPSACATGYHFASLWEMADPSNLKYNTSLGYTTADSGQGPQTYFDGWVRTGYTSHGQNTAGKANCLNWTDNTASYYGTTVKLPDDWAAGYQNIGVWAVFTAPCSTAWRVWCIED